MAAHTPEYILELDHISKTFPGVKALEDVHFKLEKGQIHALMGENGAGKSTFIKIITGVYQPDCGEIRIEGKRAHIHTPLDSQRYGIAAIYQHVTCFPDLSVTENIFLGHEKIHPVTRKIDWKNLRKTAADLLGQLDADFSPQTIMGSLSIAQQQIVEIAKALSVNAKIVIMDEPTAPLSRRESMNLYRITENMRDRGVSVIFISHRLEDMYRLASRVTILRDGKYIADWDIGAVEQHDIVTAMVGREITQFFPPRTAAIGDEVLRVETISLTGYFKDVSFSVRKGEILALTGLVGAGRTEVCESIYGIRPPESGSMFLRSKKVSIAAPFDAIAQGIGYLPEDRLHQGLVLDWPIFKNISLSSLKKFISHGLMDEKKERKTSKTLAETLEVKASSIFDKAATLSGGNQQKIIVAKLLTSELNLIILDEPTKGVDVGAKTAIYKIMNDLAESGYAIIMVSSEMPEVLGMSDRIVVMREGRVSATLVTSRTTQQEILQASLVLAADRSSDGGAP